MQYDEEKVMKAFRLYAKLSMEGYGETEDVREYLADDEVKGLVNRFAMEVDCTIFTAGDRLYFIPAKLGSPFHVKNDAVKRYLSAKATNADLYLMYFAMIVLFGLFYDSYQTTEVTRDFISLQDWLDAVDDRMEALKEHDAKELIELEQDFEYNWSNIIEKWDALDHLRETVKKQDKRTASRISFLLSVKNFLLEKELIEDQGNEEIALTEKAKTIVQKYYMDMEYNRGILEFMYQLDRQKGGEEVARHL